MSTQHSGFDKKKALRQTFMEHAEDGAVYVPFVGDGDLAKEFYLSRTIFAADLDSKRVKKAVEVLGSSARVVRRDCNRWPFKDSAETFAVADFDAYNNPYLSIAAFWASARKTKSLVMFGTDALRFCIKRQGKIPGPFPQLELQKAPRNEVAAYYDNWFDAHVLPWLRTLPGISISRSEHEYFGVEGMTYWAVLAEVSRSARAPLGAPPAKMGRPRKVSDEAIRAALVDSAGIQLTAAKKLGVAFNTVWERVKKSEELMRVVNEGLRVRIDEAEENLRRLITGEATEPNLGAICTPADTFITLSDGTSKPISEMRQGDLVLTHRGRARKVISVIKRSFAGCLLEFHVSGLPRRLRLTAEHPVYGRWRSGSCVGDQPDFRRCEDIPRLSWLHSPTLQSLEPTLDLSEDDGFFLGLYAAEGNCERLEEPRQEWVIRPGVKMRRKPCGERGGYVTFSLNPENDREHIRFLHAYSLAKLGIAPLVIPHSQTDKCVSIKLTNRPFARFVASLIPGKARTKALSPAIMGASPAVIRAFLCGYLAGDGCISARRDGSTNPSISAATASRQLAEQIWWLFGRMGIAAKLSSVMNNLGPKNRAKGNTVYQLNLSPRESMKMSDALRYQFSARGNRRGNRIASAACTYGVVLSIDRVPYEGEVWNLSVEEDESYIANFVSVHNCFFLKCRAKDRGYIERVEYDPARMSDEDLNGRIAEYIRKAGVAAFAGGTRAPDEAPGNGRGSRAS